MSIHVFFTTKAGVRVTFQRSLAFKLTVDDLERILLRPSYHRVEPADVKLLRRLEISLKSHDIGSKIQSGLEGEGHSHEQTEIELGRHGVSGRLG